MSEGSLSEKRRIRFGEVKYESPISYKLAEDAVPTMTNLLAFNKVFKQIVENIKQQRENARLNGSIEISASEYKMTNEAQALVKTFVENYLESDKYSVEILRLLSELTQDAIDTINIINSPEMIARLAGLQNNLYRLSVLVAGIAAKRSGV
jgi:hypothetical protein